MKQGGGKLVIVGGAPITENHCNFINSCDLVIRLNDCKNYDPLTTGIRIDQLYLNNIGLRTSLYRFFNASARIRTQYGLRKKDRTIRKKIRFLRSADQYCFLLPDQDFLSSFFCRVWGEKDNPARDNLLSELKSQHIITDLVSRQLRLEKKVVISGLNVDEFSTLWKSLSDYGEDMGMPTTGIGLIYKIINDPKYNGYEKHIVGFTNECWDGHPNYQEKMLTEQYCQEGRLIRL